MWKGRDQKIRREGRIKQVNKDWKTFRVDLKKEDHHGSR